MPTLLNMYFDASDVILAAFYAFYTLLGLAYCWIAFEFRIDHFVISACYGSFLLIYEFCDAIFSRLAEYTLHILIIMLITVLSILIYCYAKARQYRPGRVAMKNSAAYGMGRNRQNQRGIRNGENTQQQGKFKFAYEYPAAEPTDATRTMQIYNLLTTSGTLPGVEEVQNSLMERLRESSGRWAHLAVYSKEFDDKTIFLMFRTVEQAKRAFVSLHGMWYNGQFLYF
ncbi:hypothetical protein WR25_12431 [Diploscapter pachys]|uniref:Uncharacterized protein n=1 Tax=Diploscapter pachys TaxID=2018661 RepID=A0A2A2LFB9_9BILA|nr:hypothetical protein WR25_12431 [Diploscapter pachys]